jgi:uncharacterized protein YoxC
MYVSLQELGIFLALLVIFVAGIYVIIALNNFNKVLSFVNKNISDNEKKLQDAIDNAASSMKNINEISSSINQNKGLLEVQIPGTIENVYNLSNTLKNTGEKVDYSVDMVNRSLIETASTVQENTEDILSYVRIVSEGLRIFLEMFRKNS